MFGMAQPRLPSSTSQPYTQPFHQAPGAPVLLKKYGNRRLYDTHASRYVTLEEVEAMVQRGTDIQVVDAKTHEDLTKEILVQIILDKEQAKEMLPTGFLKQVVRLLHARAAGLARWLLVHAALVLRGAAPACHADAAGVLSLEPVHGVLAALARPARCAARARVATGA
jgi:polyhydroxyalkanoate synthesis repressor PhaR